MTHKPVKTEFRWTGDGYGNANARLIKQVKRVGDIAMYSRTTEKTGQIDGYEVVRISRHNGYTLGGQYVAPAETYPGSSQFGKSAWSCSTLDRAEALFAEKLMEVIKQTSLEASGNAPKKRGRPRKVK
jgi:hypothetical protein